MKILLIDDSVSLLHLYKTNFEKTNHELKVYSNPLEALKETDIYDIIICDYIMFDMDGLEVISKFKEKKFHAIFVLFTSFIDTNLERECTRENIIFINKSNGIKEVINLLNKMQTIKEKWNEQRCIEKSIE